ncbi:glycosyl hydrolase [Neptunitalea lumnitzerae]|uniref:Glycosyl hydrolase family 2 n=1 Tax=Neptunitalea lumnitzerae TaxID=2965509 RepID=A0ABQ5MK75_9FLAO|nr:glycosyl hydrolase [Neptunitalea sp. Y10]GLB49332.1 glycosyl hydrolase family 2 [Neptunitalea sp. Y10]
MILKSGVPFKLTCLLIVCFATFCNAQKQDTPDDNIHKPWTRWWWMGSAVDEPGIKSNLVTFSKAGLGGVEITPIYGVKGEEANFIDFLSPKYLKILSYTIQVADSLGLGVDMVLGTGWPYGGPQVEKQYAATNVVFRSYNLQKGERFKETIVHESKYDKYKPELTNVLVYGSEGYYQDVTDKLEDGNFLNWKAKKEDVTIIAVFTGKTGQKVKRAAPGGEGYTLDHYSTEAFNHYVQTYDTAFNKLNGSLRAIFNDSYEVYGTTFTPKFFSEFEKKRGYDIKPFLPQLLDTVSNDIGDRIKADYRATISDLLLDFDTTWTAWANGHHLKSRLQAHGSPGNLIDLYAAADIPECETFGSMPFDIEGFRRLPENIRSGDADPVMLKFSSSAAHVSGKPLVSSETFTWLRDHFKTALSQCKPEVESLFLMGVNHVFLHGSTYSPPRAKWPGWKFYASVNFNENNTIWKDAPALFDYIKNCQEFLQEGKPDNQTLLYWPVYDVWQKTMKADLMVQFPIHGLEKWLHGTSFYETANQLIFNGYQTDFISDRFLEKVSVKNGMIQTEGGLYKCIIVPDCTYMPLETMKKLLSLREAGAKIIFKGLPESVPGFLNFETKNNELKKLISHSNIEVSSHLEKDLALVNVFNESLVNTGLKYISRLDEKGDKIYFLVNHTDHTIDEFITLNTDSNILQFTNPQNSKTGLATVKVTSENTKRVRVSLLSGESIFISRGTTDQPKWNYRDKVNDEEYKLTNEWNLTFLDGGPELPDVQSISKLASWTTLGEKMEAFSGTVAYKTTFDSPTDNQHWLLDLGDVRESANVWINGQYVGCAWANPYVLEIDNLKPTDNTLRIEVTNLPANRIRDLELRGEEWQIFYEINMVNKDYKKFDATVWEPVPSGLIGTVKLIPITVAVK